MNGSTQDLHCSALIIQIFFSIYKTTIIVTIIIVIVVVKTIMTPTNNICNASSILAKNATKQSKRS